MIVFIFVAESVRSGSRHRISAQMELRAMEKIQQIRKRRKYTRRKYLRRHRKREHYHFYDPFLLFHKLKFIPNKK